MSRVHFFAYFVLLSVNSCFRTSQSQDPEEMPVVCTDILEVLKSRFCEPARVAAVLQSDWHNDLATTLDPAAAFERTRVIPPGNR